MVPNPMVFLEEEEIRAQTHRKMTTWDPERKPPCANPGERPQAKPALSTP